jgi:hypothetical protein
MLRKKRTSSALTGGDIRVLTTADYRSTLELIRELYEFESPPALCRHATRQLARLIPSEVASFNAIDLSELTVAATDVPEGTCSEQMRAILATHLQGHPLIATLMQLREPTALRLSDVISQNRFADTRRVRLLPADRVSARAVARRQGRVRSRIGGHGVLRPARPRF